nr:response regulator [Ktedonobacterales bacterium]
MRQERPPILLIDDDPDVLMVLQLFLEAQGYVVKRAESCAAALALLRSTATAHIVLLDVVMPHMD